jgi:hypothetical protein
MGVGRIYPTLPRKREWQVGPFVIVYQKRFEGSNLGATIGVEAKN